MGRTDTGETEQKVNIRKTEYKYSKRNETTKKMKNKQQHLKYVILDLSKMAR